MRLHIFLNLYAVVGGLLVVSGSGCVATDAPLANDGDMAVLADRYLNAEGSDDDSFDTIQEIRELPSDDLAKFQDAVLALQLDGEDAADISPEEEAYIRSVAAMSANLGTPSFDLTQDELDDAARPIADALPYRSGCGIGYRQCTTAAFTNNAAGATCAANCIAANTYDRVSNSSCELLDCDYRYRFNTNSLKSTVDGSTAAADCVIMYYGQLITRYSGGTMDVGVGLGGFGACLISGSSFYSRLRVF